MKINTHDRTPKPKNSKFILLLLSVCIVLIFSAFGLCSFVCIYYGKAIFAGVFIIAVPIIIATFAFVVGKDIDKAYIEIIGNSIHVVDYYFGGKKEKVISFSDITSAEIVSGYSCRIKGYRMPFDYIVFNNEKKYLFKVICFPETMQIFKQYIDGCSDLTDTLSL